MNSDKIKETILNKRNFEAERLFLLSRLQDQRYIMTTKQLDRLVYLESQLACVESWLKLLSDDEAFVIQRHLIDGIDIPRIVVAYRERWGEEFAKTERTIKTYQKRALQKIEQFEERKNELLTE